MATQTLNIPTLLSQSSYRQQLISIQALRNMAEQSNMVEPTYQRKIQKKDGLEDSLALSAKRDGFIPGIILVRRITEKGKNQGKLELVDGRRRFHVLTTSKKISADTLTLMVELLDYTLPEAINLYKRINETGLTHTTGEKLHADLAATGLAPSLLSFVKNSVWALYDGEKRVSRFRSLAISIPYFFESQEAKLERWAIGSVPRTYKPMSSAILHTTRHLEEEIDQDAIETMIARWQKLQQIVEKVYAQSDNPSLQLDSPSDYWPAAWLHVAIGTDPELLRKSVMRLALGFMHWRESVVDDAGQPLSLDTSHPERAPRGEGSHIANLRRHLLSA